MTTKNNTNHSTKDPSLDHILLPEVTAHIYTATMRFIQNHELREWVKESLRRAIFQKAHALAVQTGCEILIKLQDDADVASGNQYYATKVLRQAYRNNRLRMNPDEKMVSGETGMPVATQSTSMQVGGEDVDESIGNGSGLEGLMIGEHGMIQAKYNDQYLANGDTITVAPAMQLREMNAFVEKSPDRGDGDSEVRIKEEKLESNEDAASSCSATSRDISSEASFPRRSTVSINPKPYQCAVCHKAFRSIQVLQKHTQTFHVRPHHNMGSVKNRGKSSHVFNRMSLHHEPYQDGSLPPGLPPDLKGFYCMICNQDFPNSSALQDHMTVSHMETSPSLPSSKDGFTDAQNLTSSPSHSAAIDQKPGLPKGSLFVAPPDPGPAGAQQQTRSSPVPIFINLPSSSSSSSPPLSSVSPGETPFCQSSPSGPIIPHPGLPVGFSRASTSSGRRTGLHMKHLHRNKISLHSTMTAILLTAGPIVTHRAVSSYGPSYVRSAGFYIAKDQFMHAAEKLALARIGTLMNYTSPAFIKKCPDELEGDPEVRGLVLCSKEAYRMKYDRPMAKCISQNPTLIKQLCDTGVMNEEGLLIHGTHPI